jgi:acyl dehydratase
MPVTEIESVAALRDYVGREVGVSEWFEVTQERINQFAAATEDYHWIHTDPERAAQESLFKTTVAHGFLTLALLVHLAHQALSVGGTRIVINYGLNRVRYVTPVPAGARIRGRFTLAAMDDIRGGAEAIWSVIIEREKIKKPCCTVEWLIRYYA